MNTAVLFLFLVSLFFVSSAFFLSYVLFQKNIRIARFKADDGSDICDIPFESIQLYSSDGISLQCWFALIAENAPTIVLCHGLGSSKHAMLVHANYLTQAGYNVFLFDFRAHGESGGGKTSFGYLEKNDFKAGIDFLLSRKELHCKKFGVLGESMGAAVSILASVDYPEIHALCIDSCYPELYQGFVNVIERQGLPRFPFAYIARFFYELHYRVPVKNVSPVDVVGRLSPRALFFIVGTHDARIPLAESERLCAAARAPKHIWIIRDARHVEAHALDPIEYQRKVIAFFEKYLTIDEY